MNLRIGLATVLAVWGDGENLTARLDLDSGHIRVVSLNRLEATALPYRLRGPDVPVVVTDDGEDAPHVIGVLSFAADGRERYLAELRRRMEAL